MSNAPRVPSRPQRSLLQPGETIETQRLLLRTATPEDVAALGDWLSPSALSPDWQLEDLQATLPFAQSILISDKAGEALGLIVLLSDLPSPATSACRWSQSPRSAASAVSAAKRRWR